MVHTINDYQAPEVFATGWKKRDGTIGTTRSWINQLIEKEIAKPGSTRLDVLIVGGKYYVRNAMSQGKDYRRIPFTAI